MPRPLREYEGLLLARPESPCSRAAWTSLGSHLKQKNSCNTILYSDYDAKGKND